MRLFILFLIIFNLFNKAFPLSVIIPPNAMTIFNYELKIHMKTSYSVIIQNLRQPHDRNLRKPSKALQVSK